jgi:addiction module HigA family antidote
MVPKNRPPTHPGEVLLEEFLAPKKMTQVELAERMGVPVQRVNTLVNGKRGITAETALKLAKVFATSPELWMNLQSACDLWHAAHDRAAG